MDDLPEIFPLGPDGVLVRFSDRLSEPANRAALAFRAEVEALDLDGVTECAGGLTSVLVRFRPDVLHRTDLEEALREAIGTGGWGEAALPGGRTLWCLPAAFGGGEGPDLEEAAGLAGQTPDEAVAAICAAPLRVLALGFAPGQPYLGFLPERWAIPRRSDVTPEVPRGAVVVAVRQVIPFANAAPTGWRQVGRTAFRCHDPKAETPLPLRPGDEVRFSPVSAEELAALEGAPFGGATREALS